MEIYYGNSLPSFPLTYIRAVLFGVEESSSVVGFLAELHVLLLISKLIDEPQTIWR